MKYILFCLAAFAGCFGVSWVFAVLISGKMKKKHIRLKIAALTVGFGMLIFCTAAAGYLCIYYHADTAAVDAAIQKSEIAVEKADGCILFDGPGEDTALIFYPGAKVETMAYAPLMSQLAERGVDCFLVDAPFHMAIFAGNAASGLTETYQYKTWAAAGHSMGGIVAAGYAAKHPEEINTVILLASYPTAKLPDEVRLCSIYGSEDGCLDIGQYESHRDNWPKDSEEIRIEGGNHALFGNYGAQKGDGTAHISAEEQQKITVDAICEKMIP